MLKPSSFVHIVFFSLLGFLSCSDGSLIHPSSRTVRVRESGTFSQHASTFLGTPYRLGGTSRSGMDCSGLVVRLYADVYNIPLPHSTSRLSEIGHPVTLRSLETGDILFFREERGRKPTHSGIYLGENAFIHATVSKGVIISQLTEPYYSRRYAGARRIIK